MKKYSKRHHPVGRIQTVTGSESITNEMLPQHNEGMQAKMKVAGLAFLIMGTILIAVSFILGVQNASMADYITSIFMQFLPGVILIIAGMRALKGVKF
jgi:hypothetical protein